MSHDPAVGPAPAAATPPGQGTGQQPGHQYPGYQQPGHQYPGHQQPSDQYPGHQQPGYQQPGPYGSPVGYDQEAGAGHGVPMAPAGIDPAQADRRRKRRARIIVGLVAVAVIVPTAIFIRFFYHPMVDAEVGECAREVSVTEMRIVQCDSSEAQFQVVGAPEMLTKAPTSAEAESMCSRFPEAESYYIQTSSSGSYVKCLAALHD